MVGCGISFLFIAEVVDETFLCGLPKAMKIIVSKKQTIYSAELQGGKETKDQYLHIYNLVRSQKLE